MTGKMTVALYGWSTLSGDADITFIYLYHSKAHGLYYNKPELDALLDAQAREFDETKREELLQKIFRDTVNNAAHINLYRYRDLYGHKIGLKWFPRVDQRVLLFEM